MLPIQPSSSMQMQMAEPDSQLQQAPQDVSSPSRLCNPSPLFLQVSAERDAALCAELKAKYPLGVYC